MYDDKPLYQKYSSVNKPVYNQANVVWMGTYQPKESMPTPSATMTWYLEEDRKRDAKIENEIDLNQIKAAIKGVKNRWFHVVKKHPEMFLEDKVKKIKWDEVIKLI